MNKLLSLCRCSWWEVLGSSLHPCSSSFQSRVCGHKTQPKHPCHRSVTSHVCAYMDFTTVLYFSAFSKCNLFALFCVCDLPSCVLVLSHATGVCLLCSDTVEGVVSMTGGPGKHLERCCHTLKRVLLDSGSQQVTENRQAQFVLIE